MLATEIDELTNECKQLLKNGDGIQSVLSLLRERTDSKITSIKILAQLLDIPIGKAKLLVHTSETWEDVKLRDEEFSEMVNKILQQID